MHAEKQTSIASPGFCELTKVLAIILREITDEPDPILIRTTEEGKHLTLTILVPRTEIGKVIGKQGRMARTLRILMGAAAVKYQRTCSLDIRDLQDEQLAEVA